MNSPDENKLIAERRAKLAALRAAGKLGGAFPNDFRRDALAADLLALRPFPDRPDASLSLAVRRADAAAWATPRDALIDRLASRLAPERIAADERALEQAIAALLSLRAIAIEEDQLTGSVLAVTRTILARIGDLIQRVPPLPADAIGEQLVRLKTVDPDGLRVVAPHLGVVSGRAHPRGCVA